MMRKMILRCKFSTNGQIHLVALDVCHVHDEFAAWHGQHFEAAYMEDKHRYCKERLEVEKRKTFRVFLNWPLRVIPPH
jgi:hypothetical protein